MPWPWVSRLALDIALSENERLRAQNDRLAALTEKMADSLVRTERFSRGMPEQPKEPREPARMPPELLTMLAQCGDSRIRAVQTRALWQRYAQTGSWDDIIADVGRRGVTAVEADWEEETEDE